MKKKEKKKRSHARQTKHSQCDASVCIALHMNSRCIRLHFAPSLIPFLSPVHPIVLHECVRDAVVIEFHDSQLFRKFTTDSRFNDPYVITTGVLWKSTRIRRPAPDVFPAYVRSCDPVTSCDYRDRTLSN